MTSFTVQIGGSTKERHPFALCATGAAANGHLSAAPARTSRQRGLERMAAIRSSSGSATELRTAALRPPRPTRERDYLATHLIAVLASVVSHPVKLLAPLQWEPYQQIVKLQLRRL